MDHACIQEISSEDLDCKASCTSLYADVRFADEQKTAAQERVLTKNKQLTELCKKYKNKIAFNVGFSSTGNQSESNGEQNKTLVSFQHQLSEKAIWRSLRSTLTRPRTTRLTRTSRSLWRLSLVSLVALWDFSQDSRSSVELRSSTF